MGEEGSVHHVLLLVGQEDVHGVHCRVKMKVLIKFVLLTFLLIQLVQFGSIGGTDTLWGGSIVGTYTMGAFLHRLLLCGLAGFHCARGGGLAGFLGELGDGFAGGVLGGVVALHLLRVLGGGVAGGGRVVVRTAARAHGVLRS